MKCVSGPSPGTGKWSGASQQPVPKAREVGGGHGRRDMPPFVTGWGPGSGRPLAPLEKNIYGRLYVRF